MSNSRVTTDVGTVTAAAVPEIDKSKVHTDQAVIVIPGYNAPPTPADTSNWQQFNQTPIWLPQYSTPDAPPPPAPSQEIIPTLHVGKKAEQSDQTTYDINSPTATVVDQNSRSIVQVIAHSSSQPSNIDYVGSGFFVDGHGDVATALHVVDKATTVEVRTADGSVLPAQVIKTDPKSDLAELSIGTRYITQPAQIADNTNSLKKGESVIAVGHPEGWPALYVSPGKYEGKVALGDITNPADLSGASPDLPMLKTEMNTQGGDSGAPVFDTTGKVVGLVDRGDKGDHAYMVTADSMQSFIKGTSGSDYSNGGYSADANNQPSTNTLIYTVSGSVAFASKISHGPVSQFLLPGAQVLAGISAAKDLAEHDISKFASSLSNGSSGEKLKSGLNVGADVVMLGGAIGRFVPEWRAASVGLTLAGTALKVGNSVL